jgi:nucleotidyltransferase substrate binding protein (TIGR01987 family)
MTEQNLILGKISITDLILIKNELEILESKKTLTNAEKAGLIKFFELSYELAWKTLKRVLLLHNSIDVKTGTKDIFREAAKAGYIKDPLPWFGFIEDRNETIHAYNQAKVDGIISDLKTYKTELEAMIDKLLEL